VEKRHLELLFGGSDIRRFNMGYSSLKENLHLVVLNQLNGVWAFYISD
jgi:hypothetical protein